MIQGKEVTWFPSYGAEMRGGTANCTVVISDDMIGSPVVLNPDILIAMNKNSLEKFQSSLKSKGLLFFDSSLIQRAVFRKDIKAIAIPATKIASRVGSTKAANMVMFGALIANTLLIKKSTIVTIFEGRYVQGKNSNGKININSVLEGIKYIENTKS